MTISDLFVTCPQCGLEHRYDGELHCRQHVGGMERLCEQRRDHSTPRGVALDLLRYYVYRGETEAELRRSGMGHSTPACRGGFYVHIDYDRVRVREFEGDPCSAGFTVHELYAELAQERAGLYQPALF